MKHIPKDQCGISNYKCVGLQHYIQQILITCKSDDLDQTGIPTQYKASGIEANNFYNIPRSFQGVVNSTPYKDLRGSVDQYIGECRSSYDVFSQGGFVDYYGKIGAATLGVSPLSCYYNADWIPQSPGVLLPVASLSQFNPSPILTVPSWVGIINTTVQNAVTNNTTVQASQRIAKALANGTSGCGGGFGIIAYIDYDDDTPAYQQVRGSRFTVHVGVQGGSVVCGQISSVIAGTSGQESFTYSKQTGTDVIDVYANLQYKEETSEFQLKSYAIGSMSPIGPYSLFIGSVIVSCYAQGTAPAQCILKIQQAACSPVALCDPDHKKSDLPDGGDDSTVYVWTYKAKSKQLGWMPVVDC